MDIRSRRAIGQVKFEGSQVGRPALHRLVGARKRNHDIALFFFSGGGFSAPAVEYADEMEIALFHYSLTGAMTPASEPARAFLRTVAAAQRQSATHAKSDGIRSVTEAKRAKAFRGEEKKRHAVWWMLVAAFVTIYAIWATIDAFRGEYGAWQSALCLWAVVFVFLFAAYARPRKTHKSYQPHRPLPAG